MGAYFSTPKYVTLEGGLQCVIQGKNLSPLEIDLTRGLDGYRISGEFSSGKLSVEIRSLETGILLVDGIPHAPQEVGGVFKFKLSCFGREKLKFTPSSSDRAAAFFLQIDSLEWERFKESCRWDGETWNLPSGKELFIPTEEALYKYWKRKKSHK